MWHNGSEMLHSDDSFGSGLFTEQQAMKCPPSFSFLPAFSWAGIPDFEQSNEIHPAHLISHCPRAFKGIILLFFFFFPPQERDVSPLSLSLISPKVPICSAY